MIANFHINYRTKWGEQLIIRLQKNGEEETIRCQTYDGDNWHASLQVAENESVSYKYFLKTENGYKAEFGEYRTLTYNKSASQVFFQDYWRPTNVPEQAFFSAAFKDVVFRRKSGTPKPRKTSGTKKVGKNKLIFRLNATAIQPNLHFCILGNCPEFGNWENPILLSDENFPVWQAEIELNNSTVDHEYKFAIYDPLEKKIVEWEDGENRKIQFNFPSENGNTVVRTDERFRYAADLWRGAGVAIPVFSLRSENGLGIGEFTDLKLMVDWAVKTGLKIVQTLPVNDTIGTKTWKDSYPYRAISVFALHPLFVNIASIAKLKDAKAEAKLKKKTNALNKLETVDFEQVMKAKFEFFHLLYEQEKSAFLKNKEAQKFIASNADWLKPYAVFCYLRDSNKTVKFSDWKKHATYSPKIIAEFCQPKSKFYHEIAFHYFIQFHAHRQLHAATEYARKNGVVLKGDLPIGIARHSCDAWVAPQLYNMKGQAGAPPDAYSVDGQNWGFPTYNWDEMAKDNFAWWRQRMSKLAEYFDALRIDHILGFFRIWEMPTDQVIGTLGVFNPRLPYSRNELAGFGLTGNFDRYTKPYITAHSLAETFGPDADFVQDNFLVETAPGIFDLKEIVSNQLKINELFNIDKKLKSKTHLKKNLMRLVGEVLLIEEPGSGGEAYNPRITLNTTRSFKELNPHQQQIIESLYNEYHFNRHNEFWRQQALWKLPPLLQATNMFICGEDLGMIPASVAGVMRNLNLLTLEIQRMPKGNSAFGEPENYPYTSVCSPSCHDMSTIRGWWEEDQERATRFFNNFIDPHHQAPITCTPGVVETINWQYLESPSMWAIFPIQDFVGMDASLRRANAKEEQINEPSNPEHYWRYRFHITMEKLLKAGEFNKKIELMVKEAGR